MMRIALLFNGSRADTVGYYFLRACRQLGIAADHWQVTEGPPAPPGYELYLRVDHGDDYLAPLPAHVRPRVFVVSDTHLPRSWKKIQRMAPHYDMMFCAQSVASGALPNGAWLPFGCDSALHAPRAGPQTWDLAFVGTEGAAPRKFILQALRERYPNSYLSTARHDEMASIYSRARLGFNFSIANEINMRVFEVLATRTCLVTNALPAIELSRLGLRPGEHFMMYHGLEQLFPAIDALLADPARRGQLASAGFEAVTARHTYVHRIRQLLEESARRGLINFPAIERPTSIINHQSSIENPS
ncbi:MAG: glycosyltransferase family 1 protein [Candidatus Omnitrophica bacterium]|nr:glycosyltransferase family 1 protein [Candidatus Omnitrophota bacterium]